MMQEFSSGFHKIRIVGVILSGGLLVLYGLLYFRLPATVPVHMTGLGKIDGFGPKETIFLLPLLTLVCFWTWPLQLQKLRMKYAPGLRQILTVLLGLVFLVLLLGLGYFSVLYFSLAFG